MNPDYYTNTSEYSPVPARYPDPAVQMNQQMPQQTMVPPPRADGRQYTYNQDTFNIDFKEILKRGVKYLVEGLAVAFVAYYFIGKGKLNIKDIIILGITAAFVFAILDTFSPTISLGARFGAGFGIGQGLFGVNPVFMAARPLI